jgi:hypothetical protein
MKGLEIEIGNLVEAVVKAAIAAHQTQNLEDALSIRDELNRLPDSLKTDVINGVILTLINLDPNVCRWFLIDIFLRDANPEGKADVAERINMLIADLQSL